MLGTAMIKITNSNQPDKKIRALCDNGSQANLIAESVVRRLGLSTKQNKVSFMGVGGAILGSSPGTVVLKLAIPNSKERIKALFYIFKTITHYTPIINEREPPKEFRKLCLADPTYQNPGRIELLLGVKIWIRIIEAEIIKTDDGLTAAQKTKLGWVIFKTESDAHLQETPCIGHIQKIMPTADVSFRLERFWEMEDIPSKQYLSKQEELCEEIFTKEHQRDWNGRYIVKMPFNERIQELGRSKSMALKQFFAMEIRMKRDTEFAEKYRNFMKEYEELGHMTQTHETSEEGYYTPHHGVCSSTKFRVVFNASAKTSTGVTLNEAQLVGPKLQRDLTLTLINFRRFRYGITADIEKMYRQILIAEEHRKYQKILWRPSPNEPVRVYILNTVTYGQAAAPHCAVRSLIQCANDHEKEFGFGARLVRECFYVDDLIAGGDTREKINEIRVELTNLLKKGAFNLTKWRGNENQPAGELALQPSETKPVLGLYWELKGDHFIFRVLDTKREEIWTKRKVLSKIGKLYDPNGLLGPIIFTGKVIIQRLWQDQLGWDEPLSQELSDSWNKFNNDLLNINKIKIDRWFGTTSNDEIQIHGFCDASELGYGAAVYTRTTTRRGEFRTALIASKTRVAPLKKVTIPRLELCAASLLVALEEAIKPLFREEATNTYNWSDSQIVLHWLAKSSADLKVFVANRVAAIQEKSTEIGDHWEWIAGRENPADLASRGTTPIELHNSDLWWHGPTWLSQPEADWPKNRTCFSDTSEIDIDIEREVKTAGRKAGAIQTVHLVNKFHRIELTKLSSQKHGETFRHTNLLDAYGEWTKLLRVTAFIIRAKTNFTESRKREIGPLTPRELEAATQLLIKMDQRDSLGEEISTLKPRRGSPQNLSLLWDSELEILRISGRITSPNLTRDEQQPILLSKDGKLAKLLIRHAHKTTLHGGSQIMLQFLRKRFWIPNARRLTKITINKCPICFKLKMRASEQMMASLPHIRTEPTEKAFDCTGVDYCGPVELRSKLGRFPQVTKAYISVFVCLVTRAIHLELVSDMTTNAFIAAFRRFIAKRGMVKLMISDNGSNFIGANNYIRDVLQFNQNNSHLMADQLGIKWKFNTPFAPHHGGIFEAAVKSAKRHLVRVIGNQTLTFEEYATILAQVEACLNSRPLAALTDDATDLNALTPGHLLIGKPLVALPEGDDLTDVKPNRLNRWMLAQQMVQNFWKRWKDEYLMTLIHRSKWNKKHRNLQVGDLVIVRDDNLPPLKWKLARVIQTFHGADGLVRSATIKTASGEYNRPITKLGLLLSIKDQLGEDEAN